MISSQKKGKNQFPKTYKDKLANTIITKEEVEKNIIVFISLLGIGSFLIC